jgi:hypothetical protein
VYVQFEEQTRRSEEVLVAEKIAHKEEKLKDAIHVKASFASLEAEFRKLEPL